MDQIDFDEAGPGVARPQVAEPSAKQAKRNFSPEELAKRKQRMAIVGKLHGGAPKGAVHKDKTTYEEEQIAKQFADRLLAGKPLPTNRAGAVTEEDRKLMVRVTGCTVEEFQAKFLQKLMRIADKSVEYIDRKLEEDGQRLSDLNMTLAIAVDKMAAISGRTAQGGNVSVTVNNYGAMTREEMLATIKRERKAESIEVDAK